KQPPLDGDNSTSFLKASVKREFCAVCHDDADARYDKYHEKDFRIKEDSQRGMFGRASGDK
ncbi:MAG: hypothetical protein LBV09_03460, partial [Deferribacteraceae bacterium]|nr:hypothetical protein [Deferribacteraceae bacterium]